MNRFSQGVKKTAAGVARDEATAAGLKFFNGNVCSTNPNHGTIRYTHSGSCMECVKHYNKAYDADKKSPSDKKSRELARRTLLKLQRKDPSAFCHKVMVIGDPQRVGGKHA